MTMNTKEIVSKYKTEFNEPPEMTPADKAVDGPLMGNGDMGVAIAGGRGAEAQRCLTQADKMAPGARAKILAAA